MVLAAGTMTAVYMAQDTDKKDKIVAQQEDSSETAADTEETVDGSEGAEETADVNSVIRPRQNDDMTGQDGNDGETDDQNANDQPAAEAGEESTPSEDIQPTAAQVQPRETMHFSEDSTMNWPLQGTVIMNYSMDQTVYFATLDQYKYNPAVIISGEVNARVSCAAKGTVTDISTNEVTGCTVTMDLGDGYTAIYGQLKEVPCEVGDVIEMGNLVGYIAQPTKYYSVEGSNLYFAMEKDGVPVNPVAYFQ